MCVCVLERAVDKEQQTEKVDIYVLHLLKCSEITEHLSAGVDVMSGQGSITVGLSSQRVRLLYSYI